LQFICGKSFKFATSVDSRLSEEICLCAEKINIEAVSGNTLTADGFYEGKDHSLSLENLIFNHDEGLRPYYQ